MAVNLLALARGTSRLTDPSTLVNQLVGVDDIVACGERLAGRIRQALGGSGSGTLYRAGGRKQRAAAPGAPPARQRGELQGSIAVRIVEGRAVHALRRRMKVRVFTTDPGAPAEEFGFFARGKAGGILPHPFFRPSYEQEKGAMTTVLVAKLKVRGRLSAKERGLAFRWRQQQRTP
jgi:hypothetical protein